jgi:hypothetical protein
VGVNLSQDLSLLCLGYTRAGEKAEDIKMRQDEL